MPAGFREGFVEADGFRIRYMEAGEGPALVHLHRAGATETASQCARSPAATTSATARFHGSRLDRGTSGMTATDERAYNSRGPNGRTHFEYPTSGING